MLLDDEDNDDKESEDSQNSQDDESDDEEIDLQERLVEYDSEENEVVLNGDEGTTDNVQTVNDQHLMHF